MEFSVGDTVRHLSHKRIRYFVGDKRYTTGVFVPNHGGRHTTYSVPKYDLSKRRPLKITNMIIGMKYFGAVNTTDTNLRRASALLIERCDF